MLSRRPTSCFLPKEREGRREKRGGVKGMDERKEKIVNKELEVKKGRKRKGKRKGEKGEGRRGKKG